jgi:hypothetical protein
MLAEEFRRTERLEIKSRHLFTACGALFAVVMATTAGVLNALLDAEQGNLAAWVLPVLGGAALASTVALGFALAWTLQVQTLHKTDALDADTIDQYVPYAEKGNVAGAKNLITTYAQLLRARRKNNAQRARDLKVATVFCGVAATASLLQLLAVFVALISK